MAAISQLTNDLSTRLSVLYDPVEASAMARIAAEETFGREAVRAGETGQIDLTAWKTLCERLLAGMPLQYALGRAWFLDLTLEVGPSVLIPRPETEELVDHAIRLMQVRDKAKGRRILDIGTGSGCIAIAMKRALPDCEVMAIDISPEALAVATRNAAANGADVQFAEVDILAEKALDTLGVFDLIISNPPYISPEEASDMHPNVVDHEPHVALFTGDADPYVFYRAIANHGLTALRDSGIICCEISALRGPETASIFADAGYNEVSLISDMQELPRIITAVRPA